MLFILAQTPTLSGSEGWVGAGLLGAVLAWLMFVHLPGKDKQIDKLIADKDQLIKELGESHVKAIDKVIVNCKEDAKLVRETYEKSSVEQISMLQKILDSSRESVHSIKNMHVSLSMRNRLADALQSAEVAAWTKNLDGTILSWNFAAERLLGWKQGEVVGKSSYSRIVPTDKATEEKEILRKITLGESVPEFETDRLCKDGRKIRVSVIISAIRDQSGQIVGASTLAKEV